MMPMTHLDQTHQSSEDSKSISIRISVTPEKADKRGSEWGVISHSGKVNVIAGSYYVEICIRGRSKRKDTPYFGRIMVSKRDIPTLFLELVRAMINYVPETYEQWPDEDENAEKKQERERQEAEWVKEEIQRKSDGLSVLADILIKARDEVIRKTDAQ